MATIKLTAHTVTGDSAFFDFSNIPPLNDPLYVSSYRSASGWAYFNINNISADLRWRWYENGTIKGEAMNYSLTQGFGQWIGTSMKTLVGSITNNTTERDSVELYIRILNSWRLDGTPYVTIDYDPIPITITNAKFTGSTLSKDRPITLSWTHGGSPQSGYEIKYTKDNNEVIKKVTSTAKSHTFAIGELPIGSTSYQIRLTNGYIESSWVSVPLTTYAHEVTTLTPTSEQNQDKTIVVTWDSSDPQTQYELEYTSIKGTKLITGTTAKSYTIPANSFYFETVTMRIRTYNGYIWSAWKSGSFKANGIDYPNNLEPKGVAQNKDFPIKLSWDAKFQSSWELKYTTNGVSTTKTGTTERSYTIPANTIGVGTVNWELRINTGLIITEWKQASFIAFGKPETPVITSPTTFNTAYPTFAWEVAGQTGYNMQVLVGETVVYDTGDTISNVRSHTISKALGNNKTYTLRLTIKNQYGYNSDYATQIFSVNYEELQRPSFVIFADYVKGAHIIDISNVDSEAFKDCEVHRKEDGKDWVRIAKGLPKKAQFRDTTIRSNLIYHYKVRAISTVGGISDSDVKLSYTRITDAQILNLNTNEITTLKSNFKSNTTLEQDMSEKLYAGRRTTVASYGEKRYKVINISFAVKTFEEKELFEQLYYSRPTLLYRDTKGEKLYCYISRNPKIIPTKNYWTIEFIVTELSYEEGV